MPIIERCKLYEEMLLDSSFGRETFYTYDEHLLLIAQYLKRTKQIKDVQFISVCECTGTRKHDVVHVDEEGDLAYDIPHGFFHQRLKYLR